MFEHYWGLDRKDQHVRLAQHQFTDESPKDFRESRFVHHSLPQLKVEEVSLETSVAGLQLEAPYFINAMTGGTKETKEINNTLGILSYLAGIPIASGSVSAAIKDPRVAETFSVIRFQNPKGTIFANLGADHSVENAKRAVDLLEANALQIHLNAPQEMIMPEGDRDFSMWLKNIETLVREIEVPIIVKEVGFGMSRETIQQLANVGVKIVDISGAGGTDFARIEDARRVLDKYHYMHGWGQSTIVSLLEAMSLPVEGRPEFIASGGVKNALDIAKSLALGASAVGLSSVFLKIAKQPNLENSLFEIKAIREQLVGIMAVLGAKTIPELQKTDLVLSQDVAHWCQARGIDWTLYARRSQPMK